MLITSRPATDPELAALVAAQQQELREVGRGGAGPVAGAHDDLRFLVAVLGGRAVACGGLRALDDGTGELQRMYVRPAFRGRGVARQLLAALEELAFQAGHAVVCLQTHLAAVAFYTACGYERIPVYGEHVGNPYRVCLAKRLPVPA